MGYTATKVFPSINIQCKNTDPWTAVRLKPDTFIEQFAVVALDPVKVVFDTVCFDSAYK